MDIKRLLPGDEELASTAINAVKPSAERDNKNVTVERMRDFLGRDDNFLIVAIDTDAPVGFASAYKLDRVDRDQSMMLFYEIEVMKSYRRHSIARAMISKLKEICKEQHIKKMWVCTNESNIPAMQLYESIGAKRINQDDVIFAYQFNDFA
jgi:ribosomal protein S18 acetylase RimI-like enzyme